MFKSLDSIASVVGIFMYWSDNFKSTEVSERSRLQHWQNGFRGRETAKNRIRSKVVHYGQPVKNDDWVTLIN